MSKSARFILLVLRLGIGGLFIYASIDKIIHPDQFADISNDFRLLPEALINPFAVTLPWIELVMGICLVLGIWLPSASMISVGLMAMFIGGILWGILKGVEDFHCGCFSTVQDAPDDPWQVLWRDALLLAATVWMLVGSLKKATYRTSR